jgi:hypothetical protein
MRYAGGMLGGTVALVRSSRTSNNGRFDGCMAGAELREPESREHVLGQYYHVFAERRYASRPRFLEFERWWGGFYLMNREEIEWITKQPLRLGNSCWSG